MTVVLSKKNNIKNKGFTLVELLAVVAIIALLVGIAIFSVNRLFGSSNDKADEINLESIKESAVTYANENYLSDVYWVSNGNSEYSCVPILELVNKGYLKEKEISKYKNDWQFIKVNRDAINKTIISEEKGAGTCYYGVDDNGGVIFTSITKTTTSIKLQVQCNDTSKEVKGISFAFKDREYTDQMTTLNSEGKYIYEFSGLKSDKSYDIKARCNYMDGTTSKDAYKTEKTGTMNYKFILPDGSETKFNDNVKKIYKTIEIDFSSNEVTVPSYYFKSTANYTFSNKDVLECGNGVMPNSCAPYSKTETDYDGTKLREGYWYKINNNEKSTSVALDVYDNATILALGYDGGIYLDGKSTQITFMSNPYVVLNITHSNSDYSYEPKGFLGGENDVSFYTDKWMSMPKISWQIYGGYKTKSYVYYSNSTANYNSRGTYNTNNVVSGYNGKTTCNESNKCYIDATNFTKGGMQEIGIVVVNTKNGKETIIKVKVNIDKLKPEITVVNDSGGNWTNKDVITTVSYEDDHSGINPVTLSWKKENGSYTTYTDNANNLASRNVTWLANNTWAGNYTVYYKICDNAGNCSTISTPIKIDITGPTVSASVSTSWSKINKTITASATDDDVGTIGGYYISTSKTKPSATASGWQTGTTFSKGLGTYYIWAKDSLGNISSSYKSIEVINIETTTPSIAVNVSNGTSYTKSKIATITISDSDSGLSGTSEVIKYAWGTSTVSCSSMTSKTTITYSAGAKSASKTVSIEDKTGAGKIYICNNSKITDRANNSLSASNTASANMYLDNTAPIVNISIKNNKGTTINSAKDYQGTQTIEYNGGKWSPDGYKPTISFKITDDSGITNEVYYNKNGVYTGNPVTATTLHNFNSSDRTAKSGSITISSDGIRQLKFLVTDVAGNTSTISVNAWLDFVKPSPPTSVEISGTNLVLSGSYDNQSGLKNDRISFYGPVTEHYYTSTVALSDFTTVGSYSFGTSSDDKAGNNSGTKNGKQGTLTVAEKDVPVCPDGYSDYGNSTYCRKWVEDTCSYKATKTTSNKSCWLTCNPYNLATACYVTKYVTESGCEGGGYNWYEWGSYRICYANSYWCSSCSACGTNTAYSCPDGGWYGYDSYCYWDCSGYDYEKYLEDTFDCQEGYTEGSNGLCYKLS